MGTLSPALAVTGLSKRFGHTAALTGVDLAIQPGEVHGLLGHNGSGKSTLIKILAGYQPADEGTIAFAGTPVSQPVASTTLGRHGVRFVHQSLGLVDRLTVAENLWIDEVAQRTRRGHTFAAMCRDARVVLHDLGLDADVRERVSELTAVTKANLAIARAMCSGREGSGGPSLLVLDEPTAFLPQEDKQALYAMVRTVCSQGTGVLFVSHFVDEVLDLCDRVTILRDGRAVVNGRQMGDLTRSDLVSAIVGDAAVEHDLERRPHSAEPQVSVRSLRSPTVRDLSLDIARGEIVGITGLVGSGAEEVLHALFGTGPRDVSGSVTVGARTWSVAHATPGRSMRRGVGMVPADRNRFGVFGTLSLTDNMSITALGRYRGLAGLRRGRMRRDAAALVRDFAVRPSNVTLPLSALSGGNAQKVLMAKWLRTEPVLLLLEEPTQGVDVGARAQIEREVRLAADRGASVILNSSDPDQLAALCDRVLVIAGGQVVAILIGGDVAKHTIARACLEATSPETPMEAS